MFKWLTNTCTTISGHYVLFVLAQLCLVKHCHIT